MCIFFFKQKTAYEMRISDWSSDVCSSDLRVPGQHEPRDPHAAERHHRLHAVGAAGQPDGQASRPAHPGGEFQPAAAADRSEEHTSELQSLMRISYAVFCLKKKKTKHN